MGDAYSSFFKSAVFKFLRDLKVSFSSFLSLRSVFGGLLFLIRSVGEGGSPNLIAFCISGTLQLKQLRTFVPKLERNSMLTFCLFSGLSFVFSGTLKSTLFCSRFSISIFHLSCWSRVFRIKHQKFGVQKFGLGLAFLVSQLAYLILPRRYSTDVFNCSQSCF